MKNKFIFLALTFFVIIIITNIGNNSCKSIRKIIFNKPASKNNLYTGIIVSRYQDMKSELSYKNGKKEGEQIIYRDNGKLKRKEFYKNDILTEYTVYDKNGIKLFSEKL